MAVADRPAVACSDRLDLMIVKHAGDMIGGIKQYVYGTIAKRSAVTHSGAPIRKTRLRHRWTEQRQHTVARHTVSDAVQVGSWQTVRKCVNHDCRDKERSENEHTIEKSFTPPQEEQCSCERQKDNDDERCHAVSRSNENELSCRWLERAWIAMEVFS
jgi:hypothetical protein